MRVIGALILRELHTRFGRDNIGSIGHTTFGIDPAPFWITGYTAFVMFRSIVLRAESALEANGSLRRTIAVSPPGRTLREDRRQSRTPLLLLHEG